MYTQMSKMFALQHNSSLRQDKTFHGSQKMLSRADGEGVVVDEEG